ncbi:MAG: hypothetical protein IJZ35_09420 [Clostridia bacterium]|nr:hypothetical protein [Clostridia bacterium]
MAEKKVGGKPKKNTTEYSSANLSSSRHLQAEYDAFLAKYGHELRIRSTKTVPEPKKSRTEAKDANTARCGEIDPHTTVNPASEHQIFTKRTGRILSDDTGFKAMSYNDRFALKPEMPEMDSAETVAVHSGFDDASVPGQQTMADLVAESGGNEEISVPVEAKINNDENTFALAYKAIKSAEGITFGKSEKLRAIARTAADDVGMQPDSQLTFPAFSPLFRFPEEEQSRKKHIKKKNKKTKKEEQQQSAFDIEESQIVTVHSEDTAETKDSAEVTADSLDKKHKAKRIFEAVNNAGLNETEPAFEMSSKADIRPTLQKLRKNQLIELVKTALLILMCLVLGIIAAVASKEDSTVNFPVVSVVFLILAGVVCIKEFADGIKDILKLKLSYSFGGVLIFVFSLLQAVIASFSASDIPVHVLAPSAILMLSVITLPKMLLSDNAQTAVSIFAEGKGVSLFKPLSESGIEGAVQTQYSQDGKPVRYSVKTEFATGLMKKLTNAIPKPFAGNIMFVFALVFALIVGIASGVKSGSFIGAVTGFDVMLICCIPMTYTLNATVLLFMSDKKLAKNRSSMISYKSAKELTDTKAIVFDDGDIIEASACSIHGVKFFGSIDAKDAALCCGAVMNSAGMPLFEIMKKVIEQGEDEMPQVDDYILSNKGVAAIFGSKKILLGTKEFLKENRVYVPDEDFEEKYISGDRKLLYLSVNGEFCMMLIVSYHIKRNVASFFKYLVKKDINIIVHSCDPNITAEFVEKKCKLKSGTVAVLNETETAYFKDKTAKTENALPACVFTDGKLASVASLFRSAYFLASASDLLPVIIFVLSVISAVAVAIPVIAGNMLTLGNLYVVIIKLLSIAIGIVVPIIAFKEK